MSLFRCVATVRSIAANSSHKFYARYPTTVSRSSPSVKTKQRAAGRNSFRIIAGQWRGRRLAFPAGTSVRPTGDRIRETVFNWLQPYVAEAQVLDLFAGSGALGLEALSRGAKAATLVEQDPQLVRALKANGSTLSANLVVETAALPQWLLTQSRQWDLVFLDPPYPANLWVGCLQALVNGRLNPGALIYTELPSDATALALPAGLSVWRERKAGQVRFMLLRYDLPEDLPEDLPATN